MWLKSGQKNVVSLESLQREGEAFPGDDLLTGRSEKGKKIQDRTSQGDALYSVFLHFLEREQNVLEAMPEALSLPFPSPGDLPDPGIEHGSPALQAHALLSEPPGKPLYQRGF